LFFHEFHLRTLTTHLLSDWSGFPTTLMTCRSRCRDTSAWPTSVSTPAARASTSITGLMSL
jgi:hypothetical protein